MIYIIIIINILGMFLSYKRNKLTLPASISGGIISILVYLCAGLPGFFLMTAFFIMAVFATAYKKSEKKRTANDHPEKRNALQVWANSGLAAIAAVLSFFVDDNILFPLMIACVFSSAAADTISSEMGMVKGKKFINILTFQPDKKGLDGVISLEGILWGLAASFFIGMIHFLGYGVISHFIIIIISGTIGNIADSLMGAVWERKGWIGNDAVNFFNTLVAAVSGWIFYHLF